MILEPLPCWQHLAAEQIQERVRQMVRQVEEETAQRHRRNRTRALGRKAAQAVLPHDGPESPKRQMVQTHRFSKVSQKQDPQPQASEKEQSEFRGVPLQKLPFLAVHDVESLHTGNAGQYVAPESPVQCPRIPESQLESVALQLLPPQVTVEPSQQSATQFSQGAQYWY